MTLTTHGIDLNVTLVNYNTQKGQRIINAWVSAKYDSIYKAYGRPSIHKVQAFNDIVKEMNDAGGRSIRITGAGTDYFSCAYKVEDENDKTYIIYHTHVNRFAVPLD